MTDLICSACRSKACADGDLMCDDARTASFVEVPDSGGLHCAYGADDALVAPARSQPSAKVIADSVSPGGIRLTTLEVVMHRFVLAEFNTHRAFSRNSASSRAIPYSKMRQRVLNDPAVPLVWPAEQRGMQGGEPLGEKELMARTVWENARGSALVHADALHAIGAHKSVVNRLLEPFMWHTAVVTATDWDGFFAQRCSPLAQPEIRAVAEAMRNALYASRPAPLTPQEWHLPYVDDQDLAECTEKDVDARFVSAARCARTSYLTHDGQRDVRLDGAIGLDPPSLYEKLRSADPPHWSPMEHPARPAWFRGDQRKIANFRGWVQLRGELEHARVPA